MVNYIACKYRHGSFADKKSQFLKDSVFVSDTFRRRAWEFALGITNKTIGEAIQGFEKRQKVWGCIKFSGEEGPFEKYHILFL